MKTGQKNCRAAPADPSACGGVAWGTCGSEQTVGRKHLEVVAGVTGGALGSQLTEPEESWQDQGA